MKIDAEFGADDPGGEDEMEDDYAYSEISLLFRVATSDAPDLSYHDWATQAGLDGPDADPTAIPFGDGVPNLLKYAFNMNASAADNRILAPGAGSNGLPFIETEETGGNPVLVIEFLRRKSSTLQYTPQFGSDLGDWMDASSGLRVTSIDTEWERVTVSDPGGDDPDRRFGRVRVDAAE